MSTYRPLSSEPAASASTRRPQLAIHASHDDSPTWTRVCLYIHEPHSSNRRRKATTHKDRRETNHIKIKMQHAKEKVKDGVSAVKAKAKITRAKVAEKAEAATARSLDERELAHERGKAKVAAAEMELHQEKVVHREAAMEHRLHKHGHGHKNNNDKHGGGH